MSQQFKVGDVVVLKSSSPKMTVHSIDGDDVTVMWMNGSTMESATFKAAMLAIHTLASAPRGGYIG